MIKKTISKLELRNEEEILSLDKDTFREFLFIAIEFGWKPFGIIKYATQYDDGNVDNSADTCNNEWTDSIGTGGITRLGKEDSENLSNALNRASYWFVSNRELPPGINPHDFTDPNVFSLLAQHLDTKWSAFEEFQEFVRSGIQIKLLE